LGQDLRGNKLRDLGRTAAARGGRQGVKTREGGEGASAGPRGASASA